MSGPRVVTAVRATLRGLVAPRRRELLAELERRRASEKILLQRETFLTAVIGSMDIGVVAVDTDGAPVVWNAANQVAAEALPISRALAGERTVGDELETHADGVTRRLFINASPITLPDGTPVGALCTSADISKLHLREVELARANADLDAIAKATTQVLNGDDARQAVVDAALAVSDAVSATLFEPAGAGGATLGGGATLAGARVTGARLAVVAQAGIVVPGLTVETDSVSRTAAAFRTGQVQFGADIDSDAMIAVPVMRDGVPRAVLSVACDFAISTSNLRLLGLLELLATAAALAISREDAARELTRLAATDPLTGLANRRSWDDKLDEEVERARRTGLPLCVVILDLDHFKRFNDSRGHQAGDDLLSAGAASWAGVLRSGDTLARLGGEEFGVLLPGCTAAAVPGLVERLIKALPEGQTCSAGVAEWAGEPGGHTVARADEALYDAKRGGRATYRIASGEAKPGLPSPRPASAA